MVGKTPDSFGPIGPHIVSADLVGDAGNPKIETCVNGERHQSSSTRLMLFNTWKPVADICRPWTIAPGDAIGSGMHDGVITGSPKVQQVWLEVGDEIRRVIERLGTLVGARHCR